MRRRRPTPEDLQQSASARRRASAATKAYSPPLWSTEEYGVAHGGWEAEHHRVRTKAGWEVWASRWTPGQILAWEEGLAKEVIQRADASTDPKVVLRRLLEADPFASERDVRLLPLRKQAVQGELAAAQKQSDAVRQSVEELRDGPDLDLGLEPEPEPQPSDAVDEEQAWRKKKIQRRAPPGEERLRRTTEKGRLAHAERVLEPEDLAKLRNRRRAATERALMSTRASHTQAVTSLSRSADAKARDERKADKARRQALRASAEDKTEQFLFASHERVRQSQVETLGNNQHGLARRIAAMDAELAQCKVQWQRASESATNGKKDVKRHAEQIRRRKQSLEQQLDRARLHDVDLGATVGGVTEPEWAQSRLAETGTDEAPSRGQYPRPTLMVSIEQFVRRLSSVHPIEREQAQALFLKYGHDEHGRMPIPLFCTVLFTSDAHLRSIEGAHRGAFGGNATVDPATGRQEDGGGKAGANWRWHGSLIRAPRFCRTGFFAPSHWEHTAEATCRSSLEKPSAHLKLEHIYGRTMSQDVFVTRDDLVVYFAAGVGIVYDPEKHEQKFFREHTDDITCMCIHRAHRKALGSEHNMAEQEFIATGQCATIERVTPDDDPEKDRAKKVQELMVTLKGIEQLELQHGKGMTLTPAQEAKVRRRPKLQLELESQLDQAVDPKRITEKAAANMKASAGGASANAGESSAAPSTAQVRQAWEDLVDKPEPVNRAGKLAASKRERALLPPVVYIWNPLTRGAPMHFSNHAGRAPGATAPPVRLQLPANERAVACLAFSADGEKLLTISADNNHTARLWNWRKDATAVQDEKFYDRQCSARSIVGAPSMVFGCTWNPYLGESGANPSSFLTWGKKHLNVWEYNEEDAILRVPPSDQNPVDILCPGAVSCDGVQLGGEPGKFRVRVMGENNLNVLRIDRGATGWGSTLVFRVKVRPSITEPGRSPRLAVAANTNQMSKDVLTAAYLRSGHLVSGGPNGCITVYDGVKKEWLHESPTLVRGSRGGIVDSGARRAYRAMAEHQAHRPARKATHGEGHFVHGAVGWKDGGCSSLRVHPDYDDQLLSGGGDGTIRHWQIEYSPDRTDKWLTDKDVTLIQLRSIDLRSADAFGPPRQVLSVDWLTKNKTKHNGQDRPMHCMVADGENDIWMVPQERPGEDSLPELRLEGQSGDVYAIAVHPTQPRHFATACEDGCVYLWDSSSRRVIDPSPFQVLREESEVRGHRPSDLSRKPSRWMAGEVLKGRSCAFNHDGSLLAVGSSGVRCAADGSRVWGDSINTPAEGKTNRDNADRGGVLTVYALAHSIFGPHTDPGVSEGEPELNAEPQAASGSIEPPLIVFQVKVSAEAIAVIRFSPDGRLLAAGGHDNCIRLFDVGGVGADADINLRCKIEKHSSTVTHLDWSKSPVPVDTSISPPVEAYVLQSTSASYELLYFDSDGSQVKASMRDTGFETWSVPLGFPVMGMWRHGMDGTDINSCDTCHTSEEVLYGGKQWVAKKDDPKSYLAFADDRGDVNLMHWPAVVKGAPCRRAAGHSSHVMAVRWTADNQRVISAGGKDQTTFQWSAVGVKPKPPPPTAPLSNDAAASLEPIAEGDQGLQSEAAAAAAAVGMRESQPVPAAVLRAQKLAAEQRQLLAAQRSSAEVQAHRQAAAGELLTFTVRILPPPLSASTSPDDAAGQDATQEGADAAVTAGTAAVAEGLADKQLTAGMILEGNPLPQFNGEYLRLTAAELREQGSPTAEAAAAVAAGGESHRWPVLRNARGRWCYRLVKSQRWVLSADYTPDNDEACNSSILAKAGPLPAGAQRWQCWQAPQPKLAITHVLRGPSDDDAARMDVEYPPDQYQVAFVKDYAAISARGDQFSLSAGQQGAPVGWLRLAELEQRAGGPQALQRFEEERAKKAARRAQLRAAALRKEQVRLSREKKELERQYGGPAGVADETEEVSKRENCPRFYT
jgi:WD40 repeat protein